MLKVKVRWQGFTGSPGWSNFFFDDATGDFLTQTEAAAAVARVNSFITAIKPQFPPNVAWAIQSDVEAVHATSGEMFGVHTVTSPAVQNGTNTGTTYSAASGANITWRTAGVRRGRRVRGRTFLVPIASLQYDNDGSLAASTVTMFTNAATALADFSGTMPLGVWSRPTGPGLEDGQWFPVSSVTVPDKVAILRSRRD